MSVRCEKAVSVVTDSGVGIPVQPALSIPPEVHTPWKFNMIDWILHVKGLYNVCKVVREGYKMCQLTSHQGSSSLDH